MPTTRSLPNHADVLRGAVRDARLMIEAYEHGSIMILSQEVDAIRELIANAEQDIERLDAVTCEGEAL